MPIHYCISFMHGDRPPLRLTRWMHIQGTRRWQAMQAAAVINCMMGTGMLALELPWMAAPAQSKRIGAHPTRLDTMCGTAHGFQGLCSTTRPTHLSRECPWPSNVLQLFPASSTAAPTLSVCGDKPPNRSTTIPLWGRQQLRFKRAVVADSR